jgi:hypothetical protein
MSDRAIPTEKVVRGRQHARAGSSRRDQTGNRLHFWTGSRQHPNRVIQRLTFHAARVCIGDH